MTHEYGTNEPSSLDPRLLERLLAGRNRSMAVHYSRVTSSTQHAARALGASATAPFVVVADEQSAGRGRLDRSWVTPPATAVLMTLALPHPAAHETLRLLPLLAGTAVAEALERMAAPVRLKWPNDIVTVVDGRLRKLGGLIAELVDGQVLIGIGVNVAIDDDDLPTADAIALRQLGIECVREQLIADIVDGIVGRVAVPFALDDYRQRCATIGSAVRVTRVDGSTSTGTAVGVDDDGALLVDDGGSTMRITAGDVQHVRPVAP